MYSVTNTFFIQLPRIFVVRRCNTAAGRLGAFQGWIVMADGKNIGKWVKNLLVTEYRHIIYLMKWKEFLDETV